MICFQTISSVNMPMNFKAKQAVETQTENSADATIKTLDTPMETVGRSQVNFQGNIKSLSAKELNNISKIASEMKLTPQEIKVGKQALIDTMNEYNFKTVKQFTKCINNSIDAFNKGFVDCDDAKGYKMLASFSDNVRKIDSKVNVNRATSIIDDYIADVF